MNKISFKEMAEEAIKEIDSSQDQKYSTFVNDQLLTTMKGIDYDKVHEYLNRLEIKKS